MTQISQLVQNVLTTNSKKLECETEKRTAIPKHWISALFVKFQIIFGSKWTSLIDGLEEQYVAEWSVGLNPLTGKQIKLGLSLCRFLEWPPNMSEFIRLCVSEKIEKVHASHKPAILPPIVKVNKKLARASIDKLKTILGT